MDVVSRSPDSDATCSHQKEWVDERNIVKRIATTPYHGWKRGVPASFSVRSCFHAYRGHLQALEVPNTSTIPQNHQLSRTSSSSLSHLHTLPRPNLATYLCSYATLKVTLAVTMSCSSMKDSSISVLTSQLDHRWQEFKRQIADAVDRTIFARGTSHTTQSMGPKCPRTTHPGLPTSRVPPDAMKKLVIKILSRHSPHPTLQKVEVSIKQCSHKMLSKVAQRTKQASVSHSKVEGVHPMPSHSGACSNSPDGPIHEASLPTANQTSRNQFRGFTTVTAPGPLTFIVFDEKEFVTHFSDNWYDKQWRHRSVRWNGSERRRRLSAVERSLAQAEAGVELEADTDDEHSNPEEEAWRQIVGGGYLEGMRIGTMLRMPRFAMNL